ncbi:MAG: hypothetical protein ACI92S_005338, partial [Planctomycetaceae bacterium]
EHALANRKSARESDGKLHHAVHRTLAVNSKRELGSYLCSRLV